MSNLPSSDVPDIELGYLENGEVRSVSAKEFFAAGRTVVMGIPGAFTPVCSRQHIPDFIESESHFRMQGCRQLVCIAPNDPFVLDAWSRIVDPKGCIKFLSDGNLEFSNEIGVAAEYHDLFIGKRSERYLMLVESGKILRFRVEPNILTYSCSAAAEALAAIGTFDISMV